MFNFDFYNPTRICFGKDRFVSIDKNVPADAKVLITYGGGSAKKNGIIDKVKAALGKREVYEFGGIESNPRYETVSKAITIIKEKNIDFLIAVGGGSVIDGTKFMAFASYYDGDRTELFQWEPLGEAILNKIEKVLPFGTVLTLPASGSEMNNGMAISYGDGKYVIENDVIFPKFSILDPTLTYTLPLKQVANGVVDSFVHTTEQYLTYPVNAKVQDRMAEGILQTLVEIGKTTIDEVENYDARANLVWSATLALNRLIGSGVPQDWATHMIGVELTSLFGIEHGQTMGIVLPALLQVRREQKHDKLLQYAERVWHIVEDDDDKKIDMAIEKTREFFESVGVKTHLADYGVTEEKIADVISLLKEHGKTGLSEIQDVTLAVSEEILRAAM